MICKDDLTGAVKALRTKLGDSQQTFANKLGIAIRSVAHYEADRPPRGRTLVQLARLAHEAGLEREADLFHRASREELGAIIVAGSRYQLVPASDAERVCVGTVLFVLRNRKYDRLRKQLISLLREPAPDYLNELATKSSKSIRRLLDEGRTANEIAAPVDGHADLVRLANAWKQFVNQFETKEQP
ncbi:MAG: helix-turn-helix transcriptional regulator [Bryobacteraceae bacterium]